MKYKVTINLGQYKTLTERLDVAAHKTADALKTDVTEKQVVPKETGNLEGSAMVDDTEPESYTLSYTTPYAERLYTHPELNFRTDKNPHARGKWLEDWIDGPRRKWLNDAFQKFVDEEFNKK